ncbi:MAG: (Fe-S)-binding protein [Acidiferrobacter sp.]
MPPSGNDQSNDKAIPARAAALRAAADRCVACGLCLPHCPTYSDSLNENESPRGRIALLRATAEGVLKATPTVVAHIDRCLGCLACESVCPSRVEYATILKEGRALLAREGATSWRAWLRRTLIRSVDLPGAIATTYAAARLISRLPWPHTRRGPQATALRGLPARPRPPLAPTEEADHADVALFLGCTADLDRATLNAAIRVLQASGQRVHIPRDQGCCGALAAHAGLADRAHRQALRNLRAFRGPAPALVAIASGCAAELRDYDPDTFARFPEVFDIHRYLVEKTDLDRLKLRPWPRTIAVHDPCSLRNALKGERFVYELLKRIPGVRIIELPGNGTCCGAAGDYFLREPKRAQALAATKAAAAAASGADIIVSANIGCALHLSAQLAQAECALPVLHPLLVLDQQLPPSPNAC